MNAKSTYLFLAVAIVATLWSCAAAGTSNPPQQGTHAAGVWDLTGVDDVGNAWIATVVLSQQGSGEIGGYVDWIGDSGASGREYVEGSFDDRTQLVVFSGESVQYGDRVVRCEYRAVMSPDGTRLTDGAWSRKDVTVPGTWTANRVDV